MGARLIVTSALSLLLFGGTVQGQASQERLNEAIQEGLRHPTRAKYLQKGAVGNECKWAGVFSTDGISKEVRVFTDFDIVAAAAAGANSQMRPFTAVEASTLPLFNMTFATVSMTARGEFPVRTLRTKYAAEGVHMVLQLGDSLVQPISRHQAETTGSSAHIGTLIRWYDLGGVSLLTAAPLGFHRQEFRQEFAFDVRPESVKGSPTVWVIDADGKRTQLKCNFDGLRTL
jgi:hypothetical protein